MIACAVHRGKGHEIPHRVSSRAEWREPKRLERSRGTSDCGLIHAPPQAEVPRLRYTPLGMTGFLCLPTDPHRRASVLVVVLWASIGLVSIALLFGHSMMMNYRGVDNDVAGRQADQAIEGAIRYAQSLLTDLETKGNLPDLTTYEGEAVQIGEAQFWFLGRADGDINGTTREYGLIDEAARLNLNATPAVMLETLIGMTEDLGVAIDEWRTTNSNSVASTTAKGGHFESVEELALVPGMTRSILYGEDANLNGVLDANEDDGDRALPADNSDGKLDPGIYESLTVFTTEPKERPDGNGDRFIVAPLNDGVARQLQGELDTIIPDHAAVSIQPGPYESVADFVNRSGINALSEQDLDKLVPYLVGADPANPQNPLLAGMVNLNTASEAVLTAIVGEEIAADLVSERLGRGTPSTGFAWAAPLLKSAGRQAALLTGQSYQVTADIAAVGRHGRGYRRVRVVFDLTGDTPKIIYRRNLAPLGWALGREVREQLALKKNVR